MGWWNSFKEARQAEINRQKEIRNRYKEEAKLALTGDVLKLDYLGGHPKIKSSKVSIIKTNKTNTLKIDGTLVNVTKVEWDEKGKRSAGKAAFGAIAGTFIAGPLGTIAGAAAGGKKKDNSLAIITFTEGVVEHTMYLRCDHKEYEKLIKLL